MSTVPAPEHSAFDPSSRPSVSLVLGAGGARGLAHIGVIEVLEARGYRIVGIAGSSMGALVGGIHAAGKLRAYRDWVLALDRRDVLRLLDFAFGHPGLIKGERVLAVLRDLVGEHRIEELPIPFTAVATDIRSRREIWLNKGSLFDAIRASIAIPMVFTPQRLMGRELVDGGLLAPVPIAATRQVHADLVVAVDVNARPEGPRFPPRNGDLSTEPTESAGKRQALRERIEKFLDGLLGKDEDQPSQTTGLVDLMARSLDVMQSQISRMQLALDPPDLMIRVPHDSCLFYEFWRAAELIRRGREIANAALDAFEAR
jgi:NTE family protein